MLVFVIGLVVLGPERLLITIRTVVGWIRAMQSMASTVQNELIQDLKLQASLKQMEEASKNNLSPEFKISIDELRETTESMKIEFQEISRAVLDPIESRTIHNPLIADPEVHHDGVALEKATIASMPLVAPAQAQSGRTEPSLKSASLTLSTKNDRQPNGY
ncbi:MAG: twin arginine protein translocation system - TatB protein [Sodalis sp. Psp]|nr:twin arginine protein translocation system - TatB protein [Sodalis sp. Psp]MCR3756892.1 twin arginine protein translocation system - TatB protein [Sodalis sp. Ppy]